MESRGVPEAVKAIMQTHGWSQSQLARELDVPRDWISKIKRGDRDPSIGRLSRLLAGIGWEVVIRPEREKTPVKRREFITAAASVTFVPSPKVGPYENPTKVRELARRLFRAEHEHGGGAIAATAMRHIQRIAPALESRDRQLQEAASEVAVEAVWALNDERRFDAGENIGRLGLELAKRSKSPNAQSCAYSALTAINIERGRADRALMYAKKGLRLPEVPAGQQAWMRLRQSWSLALVRGRENASREELENLQGPLRGHGFPDQSLFEIANMMGVTGIVLNGMAAHVDAYCILDEAVAQLGDSSPYLQSRFLAQQVIAALGMSEPSLAADRMLALANVAPLVNSRRLDGYLRDVLSKSGGWVTVPEIRDARDHLQHLAMLQ
jgi:transcriptional regulator with XRE-family HTH domain